jgi:hypothetical protein
MASALMSYHLQHWTHSLGYQQALQSRFATMTAAALYPPPHPHPPTPTLRPRPQQMRVGLAQ